MGSTTLDHKLPTIEFSKEKLKPGTESWSKACKQVMAALEEYGSFVALYDVLTPDVHGAVFEALEEVFNLPTETKIQNKSTKPLYGYVGQIPAIPLYESMGFEGANTSEGIQNFVQVMWPHGNNSFR